MGFIVLSYCGFCLFIYYVMKLFSYFLIFDEDKDLSCYLSKSERLFWSLIDCIFCLIFVDMALVLSLMIS